MGAKPRQHYRNSEFERLWRAAKASFRRGEYRDAAAAYAQTTAHEGDLELISDRDLRRSYRCYYYSDLAGALCESGDAGSALPMIKRAIALGGYYPTMHYNHGQILFRLGREADALAAVRLAIAETDTLYPGPHKPRGYDDYLELEALLATRSK